MFEDRKVDDGITVVAVTFTLPDGERRVYLRVDMTEHTDDGVSVVTPIVTERKQYARHVANRYREKRRARGLLHRLLGRERLTTDELKERSRWENILNNPLHDFDEAEGVMAFDRIVTELQQRGLEMLSHTKKSNGEAVEEVYLLGKPKTYGEGEGV